MLFQEIETLQEIPIAVLFRHAFYKDNINSSSRSWRGERFDLSRARHCSYLGNPT